MLKPLAKEVFLYISTLVAVASCQTKIPEISEASQQARVAATGTVWVLEWVGSPKLIGPLRETIYRYDLVFSDWTPDSELSVLSAKGLSRWQTASDLFLKGLVVSQEAFRFSDGVFDISFAPVISPGELSPMATLEFRDNPSGARQFKFANPKTRLNFGGIAKGMCVGEVVELFTSLGVTRFRVDAGGGNLAYTSASPSAHVHFESRSRSFQGDKQHIFNPRKPNVVIRSQAAVLCEDSQALSGSRLGAFSDAYSTILVINPHFALPANCRAL